MECRVCVRVWRSMWRGYYHPKLLSQGKIGFKFFPRRLFGLGELEKSSSSGPSFSDNEHGEQAKWHQ